MKDLRECKSVNVMGEADLISDFIVCLHIALGSIRLC